MKRHIAAFGIARENRKEDALWGVSSFLPPAGGRLCCAVSERFVQRNNFDGSGFPGQCRSTARSIDRKP